MAESLLQQLRSLVDVDVDTMDLDVSRRHAQGGQKFNDMTSNQGLLLNEARRPENADLVKQAIKSVQDKNLDQGSDDFKLDVIDTLTVTFGKRVFPYITGSVLAQTSPSAAYSTEKTIAHAKRLVALFEENGIPKERVCIKIPATPESMVACQYLQKVGIQTLATCMFSLPQALAASQAGCKCISPYFNELRVHLDRSMWKDYRDPASENPMSKVILSIVAAFRKIKSRTLIKPASILVPKEVVALASLRPDQITIPGPILDELASLPPVDSIEPTTLPIENFDALIENDYLADECRLLREAISADVETQRKLADALVIFGDCEQDTKVLLDTFF